MSTNGGDPESVAELYDETLSQLEDLAEDLEDLGVDEDDLNMPDLDYDDPSEFEDKVGDFVEDFHTVVSAYKRRHKNDVEITKEIVERIGGLSANVETLVEYVGMGAEAYEAIEEANSLIEETGIDGHTQYLIDQNPLMEEVGRNHGIEYFEEDGE